MPWSNQGGGGGPWGGGRGNGSGGGGPWGSGRGPGGPTGGGPRGGGGPNQPNIEDMIRRGQDRMKTVLPGGAGSPWVVGGVALVLLVAWLLNGFYRVEANQVGVETIFGNYDPASGVTQPGLSWNWPWPVGGIQRPAVTTVNRVEVGFETTRNNDVTRDRLEESLMLTGDENIIDIQFTVFWVIRDAGDYLFNVRQPDQTVKSVAESAMREIIGKTGFEYARTTGRGQIQAEVLDLIQVTLDDYGAGITVQNVELQKVDPPGGDDAGGDSVISAFRDVQAARADKETSINDAQRYANQEREKAQGQSDQIVRDAEAFKEEKIAAATGEAERFRSVYGEYAKAPDVTRRRIYLETMEEVFRDMDKVLLDTGGMGGAGGSGAVPYLSIDELMRRRGRSGIRGEQ